MAKIKGIDISKWQGEPDFTKVKAAVDFVIIKATEGNVLIDPQFSRNLSELRRLNVPRGYYHFARPDLKNTPEAEAAAFLRILGTLQSGEVLCLDYEPNWNGDAVGWCKKWLDYVQNATGVKPLIYLNQSQAQGYNWQPVVDAGYGLWIASYTESADDNTAQIGRWPFAAMQQWSSSKSTNGISGNVDQDVFFGDVATFKKYGYVSSNTPPEEMISIPVKERDRLVGRSTVAKEVGQYINLSDPDNAPTKDYTKVIDGYKGAVTTAQNKQRDAEEEAATANAKVSTLEGQVSAAKQETDALRKADAILLAQKDTRIEQLETTVETANKAREQAEKDLANYKEQHDAVQAIINFIKGLFSKPKS